MIVAGSVEARADTVDQVTALSLAHVRRSRGEPGCLLHSVHHDAENPLRLVFIEYWVDVDALRAHFRVPESGVFVTEVAGLAANPPQMKIYEAQAISV